MGTEPPGVGSEGSWFTKDSIWVEVGFSGYGACPKVCHCGGFLLAEKWIFDPRAKLPDTRSPWINVPWRRHLPASQCPWDEARGAGRQASGTQPPSPLPEGGMRPGLPLPGPRPSLPSLPWQSARSHSLRPPFAASVCDLGLALNRSSSSQCKMSVDTAPAS